MRMTARSCYAILVAAALAEAYPERRAVPASRLAEATGAPEEFLNQVLQSLRRAGVVESVRGVTGGFRLASAPERIPVGKLLRAADGRSSYFEASSASDRASEGAARAELSGVLGLVVSEADRSLVRTLDTLTLGEVLSRALGSRAAPPEYQI